MIDIKDLELLSKYYAHKLPVCEAFYANETSPNDERIILCNNVIDALNRYSLSTLVDIIKVSHQPFEIRPCDISQFSDFNVCAYKTPYLIFAADLKDISYRQMGFILLQSPKKEAAYKKYGENHAKTAAQIGLCAINKGKINISCMGVAFLKLSEESQQEIIPKLLLYIPLIQNYFTANKDRRLIEKYLSQLSLSTQKRRISNINTLITIVERALK